MSSEWSSAGTGAGAGAAAGATAGSVLPGVGTLIGAGVGALVGGTAGYIQGRGIKKRQKAQEAAEQKARDAQTAYMGGMRDLNAYQQELGGRLQGRYGDLQTQSLNNQIGFARNQDADFQQRYARAMQSATQAQAGVQAQMPALRTAAQGAYARQMADTAGQRANMAMMPGAYVQAQRGQADAADRLGDQTQLAGADLARYSSQEDTLSALKRADIERSYAQRMAEAGVMQSNAGRAGSEQMMYGGMMQAGLNLGMGAAGAARQYQMGQQRQQQDQDLYSRMMQYYNQQPDQMATGGPYDPMGRA